MLSQTITLSNKKGLHARAASLLVQTCQPFNADLSLTFNHKHANCKNIMQLLMLAAPCGSPLTLTATGADAQPALTAALTLINNRFNEPE